MPTTDQRRVFSSGNGQRTRSMATEKCRRHVATKILVVDKSADVNSFIITPPTINANLSVRFVVHKSASANSALSAVHTLRHLSATNMCEQRQMSPTFVGDKHFLSATCQRMRLSSVTRHWLVDRQRMSPTFLWCRQEMSATYVGKCEQRIKRAFWYVYAAEVERHPTAMESIGLRRRRYRSRTGESDLESGHRPLQLVRTARYVASSAHCLYYSYSTSRFLHCVSKTHCPLFNLL